MIHVDVATHLSLNSIAKICSDSLLHPLLFALRNFAENGVTVDTSQASDGIQPHAHRNHRGKEVPFQNLFQSPSPTMKTMGNPCL